MSDRIFARLHGLAAELGRASDALKSMSVQSELVPGEQCDVRRAAELAGQAGMLAQYVATTNLPCTCDADHGCATLDHDLDCPMFGKASKSTRKPYAPPALTPLAADDPRVQAALRGIEEQARIQTPTDRSPDVVCWACKLQHDAASWQQLRPVCVGFAGATVDGVEVRTHVVMTKLCTCDASITVRLPLPRKQVQP